jgi:hypothetical protein
MTHFPSEFGPRCHVTLEGAELSRSWEPSCHAPVKKLGGYPVRESRKGVSRGGYMDPPREKCKLYLVFFITSVVPAPDGAETRDMCPREYL